MSEMTTEEVLALIEKCAAQGKQVDLSGKDLSGIDLSRGRIVAELRRRAISDPAAFPAWVWWDRETREVLGINLQEADLWRANLQEAILGGANLQGAGLNGANLQEANLEEANLQGATLWRANLQEANLEEANLREAWLVRANLEHVNLQDVESLEGAYFQWARLAETYITREKLGRGVGEEILRQEYGDARDAYRLLKRNFRSIGDYDAAKWAYLKERRMNWHSHCPRGGGPKPKWWKHNPDYGARRWYGHELAGLPERGWRRYWRLARFYAHHTRCYVLDWLQEWVCGYGTSPLRVLRALGFTILAFALVYWGFGAFKIIGPAGCEFLKPDTSLASYFIHSLEYSVNTFTDQFESVIPTSATWVRPLAALERVVGIALIALLGFVVGNEIRRV